jgi:hypothetical protein
LLNCVESQGLENPLALSFPWGFLPEMRANSREQVVRKQNRKTGRTTFCHNSKGVQRKMKLIFCGENSLEGRERENNGGDEPNWVHYVHIWKRHNEPPCTTIIN